MSLYPKSHYNYVLQLDGTLLWAWKLCRYSRIVVISAVVISEVHCIPFTLDTTIDLVRHGAAHTILAGDFNVHNARWLVSTKTTLAGEYMEEVAVGHQLTQHVSAPTRGLNTLDLILSDYPETRTSLLPPLGKSDHQVVLCSFVSAASARELPTSRRVWRYNLADWSRLRAFLRTSDWDSLLQDDPEEACTVHTPDSANSAGHGNVHPKQKNLPHAHRIRLGGHLSAMLLSPQSNELGSRGSGIQAHNSCNVHVCMPMPWNRIFAQWQEHKLPNRLHLFYLLILFISAPRGMSRQPIELRRG